jgi:hypothetical protein
MFYEKIKAVSNRYTDGDDLEREVQEIEEAAGSLILDDFEPEAAKPTERSEKFDMTIERQQGFDAFFPFCIGAFQTSRMLILRIEGRLYVRRSKLTTAREIHISILQLKHQT